MRVRRRRIWVIQQQKGELAERQRRAGVWSKALVLAVEFSSSSRLSGAFLPLLLDCRRSDVVSRP